MDEKQRSADQEEMEKRLPNQGHHYFFGVVHVLVRKGCFMKAEFFRCPLNKTALFQYFVEYPTDMGDQYEIIIKIVQKDWCHPFQKLKKRSGKNLQPF